MSYISVTQAEVHTSTTMWHYMCKLDKHPLPRHHTQVDTGTSGLTPKQTAGISRRPFKRSPADIFPFSSLTFCRSRCCYLSSEMTWRKKKSHSARPHENVLLNAHYCKFRFYFYCKGWKVLESYFLFLCLSTQSKTPLKIFMTKANRDFF